MSTIDLKNQIRQLTEEAKKLYAEMEADETKRTADNREKLDKILEDGQNVKQELRLAELDDFVNAPDEKNRSRFLPVEKPKSWGRQFIESEEYKRVQEKGFREPKVDPVEVKSIYATDAATGGATIFSERQTEIYDRVPTAPTTLLDILNVSSTNSSSIEYVVSTGFTNNAAPVKEWDTGETPDNFGLKPESTLTFALVTDPVQTIAHWAGASRNILADAPRLENFINVKMIEGLRRILENQVVSGDGTSPNISGILDRSGIQTRSGAAGSASARYAATDTILDTVRRAITDVALAFGQADAVVLHPADAEKMELMKDDNSNYMNVFDPVAQRVWRVRVVENLGLTANRGLVGDFSMGATLYLREDAVIRVSESHADFFIRNAIVILAELRAALAVTDPELFVDVNTLT